MVKEKIDDFSKGIFRYEQPELILSTDRISLRVVEGEQGRGSFHISNSGHCRMEVLLFCDDGDMELSCQKFIEEQKEINYCYHAEQLDAGQKREGTIALISSQGEILLPYEITVVEPGMESSIGQISDLFQFAGLAKTSWEEARELFASDRFAAVCLRENADELLLYRGLIRSSSVDQAMEEFLRAIRKKTATVLRAEVREQEYHLASRAMRDVIRLSRDGWGYLEAEITTDTPYLTLEKQRLGQDDFTAGVCELPFVLEPERMKNGRSTARVWIRTMDQELMVEFQVYHTGNQRPRASVSYKRKAYEEKILRNYIWYRLDRMTRDQYVTSNRAVLYGLQVITQGVLPELVGMHLNLLSGRKKEAGEALVRLKEQETQMTAGQREFYGYLQEQLVTMESGASIKEWKLLSASRPSERLRRARELFQNGNRSPILYLEAWQAWKEAPELLTRLEEFEIQVMNWSRKQQLWEESLSSRYVYLAEGERSGRRLIRRYLEELYQKRPGKETLNAICTLLLRQEEKQATDALWYQRGVEQGLKLTGLYEAYMDTFSWESGQEPDARVYTYFWKDNGLSDQKKAMLYAHIIQQKNRKMSVYQNYQRQMKEYARDRMAAGEISPQLAVIYEDLLEQNDFCGEMWKLLPGVMFRNLIICDLPHMRGVCIWHAEEEQEEFVPFDRGCAYVDIYTESVRVLLEDEEGRRYAVSRPYEWKKLMRSGDRLTACYDAGSRDRRLLLALSARMTRYHKQEIVASELQRELLEFSGLEAHYRNEIMGELIQYYYDHLEGGPLEGYLAEYNLACASERERARILNLMLMREMYVLAGEALELYGYAGVSLKYLQRLCSRRISEAEGSEKFLVELCWYLFQNGKSDAIVLSYLTEHYEGSSINLYAIWEAAAETGLQTSALEEKLLTQMLFTESILMNAGEVYRSYERKVHNEKGASGRKLLRAFLSYLAYRYLVFDQVVEESLFADMRREVFYEDTMICKAAALKYYSRCLELTDEEKEFAEVQMERMAKVGCVLPFFQKFQGRCRVPAEVPNRSYAVYITNPGEVVDIHYRVVVGSHATAWQMERMPEVFYGIHVKEMLLFYGEKAQYYISTYGADRSDITESTVLEMDQMEESAAIGVRGDEEEACQLLNLMLIAQEIGDEATQVELMKQYIRQNYVKDKLFKPM